MPGLIQDRYGTYYVQRKVPERLQEAVARVLNSGKSKQVFLKKSLGTKVLKEANVAATHVLADFNRTLANAEALLKERPVIESLTDAQIRRMAEMHYAALLAHDEEERSEGTGSEPLFQNIAKQLSDAGIPYSTPFKVGSVPEFGLSDREIYKRTDTLEFDLAVSAPALARGDVSVIGEELDQLLDEFQLNLDRKSASYRKLGMAVLAAHVRALRDIERRNAGEPVETPASAYASPEAPSGEQGGTLREAFEGWKKERDRPEGTVHEYGRAVEMFIQLHGDLPVLKMRRSHARTFREALQLVPKSRRGALLKASLPELRDYGSAHPTVPKVSPGTVNKQLGALQAIAGWGHHHGLVPDDVPWADPFAEMRLEEEQSEREPFDARDLQTIFDAPLFTQQKLPAGAKGEAGVWLPLLALFAGARQAEYAGLRVSDIRTDEETGIPLMWFSRDPKAGRRLKTKTSERVVPVHPQLVALGFLKYVEARRQVGDKAWLFPTVAPDQKGALSAWSKWWGRYLRTHVGIHDRNKVYHSFRHGFQDALRRTTPDEELRDALTGRSSGKSVGRTYGAKAMLQRWGAKVLKRAVDDISYPGLDVSRVRTSVL
ncbi:site-specific integrase [Bradyrhizobium sp. RP6]|uniref:site-specific integrase n=1 Tax=Bradyrhizobium sp. RP6 TaxID=2489596 RepID=UPI000F523A01|nr:site-specific integrase [Bradyrhizobium sp. RP6]RQH12453.1 site-specific integrase [Bradyrhizobium sp. RP6]